MRVSRVFTAAIFALAALPSVAIAQLVDAPPGSVRGLFGGHHEPDPNRNSQRMTMTFDVSGGNGDLVNGGVPESDATSDFGGIGAAAVQYWAGRAARYIDVSASSYVYFNSPTRPIGSAGVSGVTNVGRRNTLYMSVITSYEPTLLGESSAAPVQAGWTSVVPHDLVADSQLSNPPGVIDERWLDVRAAGGLQRAWTTRQRSEVRYERSGRRPIGGAGYDSRSQLLALGHRWTFSPGRQVQLSYQLEENQLAAQFPGRALRFHSGEAGVELRKLLPAGRSVFMTLRGGAAYAQRQGNSIAVPLGSAAVHAVVLRSWTVSGEVRRDVSVLEGLSLDGFANDVIAARTNWHLGRRTTVGVSVDRSWGTALASGIGNFDRNAATAEVQYGIAPWCGVFSSLTYYEHRYRDIASVPEGFPTHYNRRSVWFGINFWVPLFGTF